MNVSIRNNETVKEGDYILYYSPEAFILFLKDSSNEEADHHGFIPYIHTKYAYGGFSKGIIVGNIKDNPEINRIKTRNSFTRWLRTIKKTTDILMSDFPERDNKWFIKRSKE